MGQGSSVPNRSAPDAISFGKRLAGLRRDAGYTQEKLASEIGITRAKLAYYEGQTELPLTGVLRALSLVLDTTADELLGLTPRAVRPPDDAYLQQRFEQIGALPSKEQRQLIRMIDAFLGGERTQES
jgi:transcriptional regulator with XRE-family HTH domain